MANERSSNLVPAAAAAAEAAAAPNPAADSARSTRSMRSKRRPDAEPVPPPARVQRSRKAAAPEISAPAPAAGMKPKSCKTFVRLYSVGTLQAAATSLKKASAPALRALPQPSGEQSAELAEEVAKILKLAREVGLEDLPEELDAAGAVTVLERLIDYSCREARPRWADVLDAYTSFIKLKAIPGAEPEPSVEAVGVSVQLRKLVMLSSFVADAFVKLCAAKRWDPRVPLPQEGPLVQAWTKVLAGIKPFCFKIMNELGLGKKVNEETLAKRIPQLRSVGLLVKGMPHLARASADADPKLEALDMLSALEDLFEHSLDDAAFDKASADAKAWAGKLKKALPDDLFYKIPAAAPAAGAQGAAAAAEREAPAANN
eukprot:tig00001535_g9289.t1